MSNISTQSLVTTHNKKHLKITNDVCLKIDLFDNVYNSQVFDVSQVEVNKKDNYKKKNLKD